MDPEHQWHTQKIENLWMLVRHDLRNLRGVDHSSLQMHLDVFAFRRNMQKATGNVWRNLCCVIGAMQSHIPRPCFWHAIDTTYIDMSMYA